MGYAEKLIAGEMYHEMMVVVLVVFSAIIATIASLGTMSWGAGFAGAMVFLLTCVAIGTTIRIVGGSVDGN